jgi:hypothetical protein
VTRQPKPAKPMGRVMRAVSKTVLGKDMGADSGPTDTELRELAEGGSKPNPREGT